MWLKIMTLAMFTGLLLNSCGMTYNQINDCIDSYRQPDWATLRQEYTSARQRWDARAVKSYSYLETPVSWITPRPVRVEVVDGEVVSVNNAETGLPTDLGSEVYRRFYSLEVRLESIEAELSAPSPCASLSVKYDPTYGFPTSYGWGIQKNSLADAAGGYVLSEFSIWPLIPPPSNLQISNQKRTALEQHWKRKRQQSA